MFRCIRSLALVALAAAPFASSRAQAYHSTAQWDTQATGGFDYLLASPKDHRLYIAQGTQIVVMDIRSGTVVGHIEGLQHAHGVALDGSVGYLTDGGANKVVVFDVASLKVTGEIATGGDNPDSLVLDPSSGWLYTFNGRSKQGVAIDVKQRKVVGRFAVPGKPEFSQADGEGHVFVNIENTSQLLRIASRTHTVDATWKLDGCEGPSGLALDRKNRRLFSVCDGAMAVTDADSGKLVARVPIGQGPDAVWYDADRHVILASNGESGTLSVVKQDSADKYRVVQTLKTGIGARTMALDGSSGKAYVMLPGAAKGAVATAGKHLMIDVIAP